MPTAVSLVMSSIGSDNRELHYWIAALSAARTLPCEGYSEISIMDIIHYLS